jgi:hypothetical protein
VADGQTTAAFHSFSRQNERARRRDPSFKNVSPKPAI